MSETVLPLSKEAEEVCIFLGEQGITHLVVQSYQSNSEVVTSATATGDCGDGPVTVTAIQEGRVTTYMMEGPDPDDDGAVHVRSSDVMRGVYCDVGHELLWLLATHPDEGALDLPLKQPTEFELPQSAARVLPTAA
jgi:hypothetical protein